MLICLTKNVSFPLLEFIQQLSKLNMTYHLSEGTSAKYEAYKRKTGMTLIALQPPVPDQVLMPHTGPEIITCYGLRETGGKIAFSCLL